MFRSLITGVLAALTLTAALGAAAAAAVDVNQASAAELEAVKGIGPAMSAKITGARQHGPFKDWADLVQRVSGLGPGNAARLSQAGLTVAGAAYVPAAAADGPKAARTKKADRVAPAKPTRQP
jgi:competence protein ComEA